MSVLGIFVLIAGYGGRDLCRLSWPGGDLLFRGLSRSTIGAAGLYGRVRDGIGCFPRAMATRPTQTTDMQAVEVSGCVLHWRLDGSVIAAHGRKSLIVFGLEIDRTISTSKLHALLRFHTWPIDVVVREDRNGRTSGGPVVAPAAQPGS